MRLVASYGLEAAPRLACGGVLNVSRHKVHPHARYGAG